MAQPTIWAHSPRPWLAVLPQARPGKADGRTAADGAAEGASEATAPVPAAAGSDLVAVFGGCMDQSTFPYLARSYVQTAELWLGDLGALA